MSSVAVIGGGVTGLTAAFRLKKAGADVTVYESGSRCGGVIRTIRKDGFLIDAGPNTILETSPELAKLVDDLKLTDRRVYAQSAAKNRYVVRNGRPLALPSSPMAFFTTPLFSTGAKLRLLREPFIAPAPAEVEDETVAAFVTRRIGREFLDYAINPFVAGIFAGDPKRLSVKYAFPKLREVELKWGSLIKGQILGARERKRNGEVVKASAPMFSFDGGLQVLPDALHKVLEAEVLLNSLVTGLIHKENMWHVTCRRGGLRVDAETREYDAVLVALPAYAVAALASAALASEAAPSLSSLTSLADVPHPPVTTVSLGFRREDIHHPLDGYGILVPEVEKMGILGTLFISTIFADRAPAGHVVLTSFLGGTRSPETARLDERTALELTLKDLGTLIGVTGNPVFVHQEHYERAIPQLEVGHGRFLRLVDTVETSSPGLFFAGNYRGETSLAGAIRNGTTAAERLQAYGATDSGVTTHNAS